MMISVIGFSAMGIIYRGARHEIGPMTAVLWRNIVGLLCVLAAMPWLSGSVRGRRRGMLVLRAVSGAVALFFYFLCISSIDLGTATALCYTYPVFASFLSAVFLKEHVSRGGWAAILVAWAAIGIMAGIRPAAGIGEVYGILSGILAGVAIHSLRALRREGEPLAAILFYFFVISGLLSLPLAYREDCALGFHRSHWMALAAIGVSATIGQAALTMGYQALPTHIGSPMSLLVVPLSMAGAYVFHGEPPRSGTVAGTIVLAFAVAYLARTTAEDR